MTLKKINVEDAGEILDEKTGMLETGASEKEEANPLHESAAEKEQGGDRA